MRRYFVILSRFFFLTFVWTWLFHACVFAENPFRDVPLDHFAYDAIQKLSSDGLMKGYEDGTFKGRRVMTRYEIAVILAKMLARMEELKKNEGSSAVSPQNEILMGRLSTEFRSELDLLGVRIDSLEKRVLKVENDTKSLDQSLSNVHVEGFYEGSQEYYFRSNKYTGWENPGLHRLNQDVFLRFIGNPKDKNNQYVKNIEAFVELKGNLSGYASDRLNYAFSDKPKPGDTVDDFATDIQDDRKVMVNKAHFKSKAPLMNLRVFSGEQFTDLKDPAVLLTASEWKIARYESGLFSGIEADGAYKRWTYYTSVLKRIRENGSMGGDIKDLFSEFEKKTDTEDDTFAFRTTYKPMDLSYNGLKRELTFGSSFVEHATDYSTRGKFNRVIGWDMKYSQKRKHSFDMSLVQMISEGLGVHDEAQKVDMQFENDSLLMTLKGYAFGKDFVSDVASYQYVDTDNRLLRGDNYGRGSTKGERLFRMTSKYTFKESQLSVLDNLTMTLTGQSKWWEDIQGQEGASWYGRHGTLLSLRTVADFNDRTHAELYNEIKKDAKPDEEGKTTHSLDMDVKLTKDINVIGNLTMVSDFDYIVENQHYTKTESTLEMNSKVHPRLYLKGKIYDKTEWGGRNNQKDTDIVDLEAKYDLFHNVSLKQFLRRKTYTEAASLDAYKVTDYWISELNVNFSRTLEARSFYAWQSVENRHRIGDDFWNWFAEVSYEPTKATEIILRYGYDYDDSSHPGRFEFENTQQKLMFKAQTDF